MAAGRSAPESIQLTLCHTRSREVVDILVVVIGSFVAVSLSFLVTCDFRRRCLSDGRCFPANTGFMSGYSLLVCSANPAWVEPMQTYVCKSGHALSHTLGICAPGLGVAYSKIYERPVCQLERMFPSSFNSDVGMTASTQLIPAACGRWTLTVDRSNSHIAYLGLDAARESVEAMVRVSRYALGATHAPLDNSMSFNLACGRLATATVQTMQSDLMKGYTNILSHTKAASETRAHALTAAAAILGFGCDGFVDVSVHVDGGGFVLHVQDGPMIPEALVKQALAIVGEPPSTAETAFDWFSSRKESKAAQCDWAPTTTQLQELLVVASRIGDTTGKLNATLQLGAQARLPSIEVDRFALHGLRKLVCTMQPSDGVSVGHADAAIKGVAAVCAAGVMANRFEGRWETPLWSGMREYASMRQQKLGRSRSLGRLAPRMHTQTSVAGTEHGEITESDWEKATGQTLGILMATVDTRVSSRVPGTGASCQDITDTLFPAHMERSLYASSVPSALASRVHHLADGMKTQLAAMLRTDASVRVLFEYPDAIAFGVERSRISITGEPRTAREPTARIAAGDGPTTQGLLQSAAMTSNRLQMALLHEDVCSHPSLLDPEDINAYYLHPFGCIYLSVGMLLVPFADHAYNDFSLLANLGFVVAHELAHNTHFSSVYQQEVESTLHLYRASAHTEAIADTLAAIALMKYTNTTDYTKFALFQAQTWCAVAGHSYVHSDTSTHPDPTRRIEILCKTLHAINGYTCAWAASDGVEHVASNKR